jgi:hypothetical protein
MLWKISFYYQHLRCSIQQMHKAPSDLEIAVEELLVKYTDRGLPCAEISDEDLPSDLTTMDWR